MCSADAYEKHSPQDQQTLQAIQKSWDDQIGDARQEIVLIGMNMDKFDLIAQFDACLLSDEEMAQGADQWKKMSDPFIEWEYLIA